jgi:hypothetical protein
MLQGQAVTADKIRFHNAAKSLLTKYIDEDNLSVDKIS